MSMKTSRCKIMFRPMSVQTAHNIVSTNQQILNRMECRKLRDMVEMHVYQYVYNILKISPDSELTMDNSWLLINMPRVRTNAHVHRNAFVSWIVYIQTSPMSGDIIISVPSILLTWATPALKPNTTEHNIYNLNEFRLTPRDGMIVIFPGHTHHGVSENLSKQHRYCFSLVKSTLASGRRNGIDHRAIP